MEKTNKYYKIIETIVKKDKKFPGHEAILEDIIDDVFSHSEVIINSVSNEQVIFSYLEKVTRTSIITVAKKLNYHKEINHKTISINTNYNSQNLYVEKMINSLPKEDYQIENLSKNNELVNVENEKIEYLKNCESNEEPSAIKEDSFEELDEAPLTIQSDSFEESNEESLAVQEDSFEELNEETLAVQEDSFEELDEDPLTIQSDSFSCSRR